MRNHGLLPRIDSVHFPLSYERREDLAVSMVKSFGVERVYKPNLASLFSYRLLQDLFVFRDFVPLSRDSY
jgi:hypothetical protein